MPILHVKDGNGNFVEIPALKGNPGKTPVRGVDYWTEEDREQIVGEVLDEVDGGEWELIETITLEEDTTSLQRDIRLYGAMVLATFPAVSKSTNAFMAVSFDDKQAVTGSSFMREGGTTSVRFNAEKRNPHWDLYSQGYVRGWGSGSYYGQGNAGTPIFVSESPMITRVRLYAADGIGYMPTGSVIEIWGVRANA